MASSKKSGAGSSTKTAGGFTADDAAFTEALDAARAHAGDRAKALDALLNAWLARPDAEVGDAVEDLARRAESPAAKELRELAPKETHARWIALEKRSPPADRGALLETLHRGTSAEMFERMERVFAWPADPRTGRALARWLLDLPFRATETKPSWTMLFERVQHARDVRVLATVRDAKSRGFAVGKSMGDWLREKTDKALAALEREVSEVPAPDDAAARARDAALAALSGPREGAQGGASNEKRRGDSPAEPKSPAGPGALLAAKRRAPGGAAPALALAHAYAARVTDGQLHDYFVAKGGDLWLTNRSPWRDYGAVDGAIRDAVMHAIEGLYPRPASADALDRVDDPGSAGAREALPGVCEVALYSGAPGTKDSRLRWAAAWPGVAALASDGSAVLFVANETLSWRSLDDGRELERVRVTDPGFEMPPPDPKEEPQGIDSVALGPGGLCAFTFRGGLYVHRRGTMRAHRIAISPGRNHTRLAFDARGRTLLVALTSGWRTYALDADPTREGGAVLCQSVYTVNHQAHGEVMHGLSPDGSAVLRSVPYTLRYYTESHPRTGVTVNVGEPETVPPSSWRGSYVRVPSSVVWVRDARGGLEPCAPMHTGTPKMQHKLTDFVLRRLRDGADVARIDAGPSALLDVALPPDGSYALATHADGIARLWAPGSSEPLGSITDATGLAGARISPDGTWALSRARVGLQAWQLPAGKAKLKQLYKLRAHAYQIHAVAFAPDGARYASASEDATAAVYTHASQGKERVELRGHAGAVRAVAFHPSEPALVATAGRDATVRLWDARDGRALAVLRAGDAAALTSLAFSADGALLFAGSMGGVLYAFRVEKTSLECVHAWGAPVAAVAVCPRTGAVYASAHDRTVRSADATGAPGSELLRTLVTARCLDVSADGRALAVGAGTVEHPGCLTVLRAL